MTNWYLKRDPLLTTEHIVRNKRYDGWSHKDVMKLIHLHSKEPCNLIINDFFFVYYILYFIIALCK